MLVTGMSSHHAFDRCGSHLRWANGVRSLAVLCNLHRHRKTHRLVLEPWCTRSPQYFTLTVHLSISAYLRAFVLNGFCSCSARSISAPKASSVSFVSRSRASFRFFATSPVHVKILDHAPGRQCSPLGSGNNQCTSGKPGWRSGGS